MLVMAETAANSVGNILLAIMLVLTACGCFIVGINLLSRGFVRASSTKDSFFTRGFGSESRFGGITFGFLHSAFVQSSDVTTVTLVRLVDIGQITLLQACACVIGANIGTTITSFIVSLSSFNLTPYFAFCAFIGAIPLLSKNSKARTFGDIIAGFGILFIGLELLQNNLNNESFRTVIDFLFNSTSNSLLLILIGTGLTMIVQSSSVTTSMVVFLISGALLPMKSALCLVAGANLGTCITCAIAAVGGSRNSRRTALFHSLFNVVGLIIFIIVICTPIKNPFLNFVDGLKIEPEFKVSLFHLAFNLAAALVVIPLLRPFVWLCKKIIRR